MIVRMKMTEEEAREFLEHRKNKDHYRALEHRVNILCQMVKDALEPVQGQPGQYVIADQDNADDLWNTVLISR